MSQQLTFHDGQANITASDENPYPVKVMQDVQARNVYVAQDGPQQVAVTTTVTLIVPANPQRRSVLLTNLTGTQLCYLGIGSGDTSPVLASTTARAVLTAAVGSSFTIFGKDAIYGLAAVATQTVMIWEEEYDGRS